MSQRSLMMQIYKIMYDNSDADHPLTHADIIKLLDAEYDVKVERKAIGKHLSYLEEMGYEIIKTSNGSYLSEKIFEPNELRLLIDNVLCSSHINKTHSKNLIDKLVALGGKHFKKRVRHICHVASWKRSENQVFFLNIDLIDEAIDKCRQITFDYYKYGPDKKLHKTSSPTVSPYQMVLHNQHYYLMGKNEHWGDMTFWHIEKIRNIVITDEPLNPVNKLPGYEMGIDYKELSQCRPYMYADKLERVEFICPDYLFDDICEWFGTDFDAERISPVDEENKAQEDAVNDVSIRDVNTDELNDLTADGVNDTEGNQSDGVKDSATEEKNNEPVLYKVSLVVSPKAMKYWSLQYGTYVEVLSPAHLRDAIKEVVKVMKDNYKV